MDLPRVEHLLLLVGENPLPNAVVGRLLVEQGGTITLLHTPGSARVAENLKRWLEGQLAGGTLKLKEIRESEPSSIYRGIKESLEGVPASRIGLNYTGGTKLEFEAKIHILPSKNPKSLEK